MRACSVCKATKNESEFFFRDKRLKKLHSQCKDCYVLKRGKIWREHYHKYGSKYRQRAVERNRIIKSRLRLLMVDYLKDKKCNRCGWRDPRALEFHHAFPEQKTFSIARAVNNTISWERILVEMEKCEILCANCHKIQTSKDNNWYKEPV